MKSKETIVNLMEQYKFDLKMEELQNNKEEIKRIKNIISILGWVISD